MRYKYAISFALMMGCAIPQGEANDPAIPAALPESTGSQAPAPPAGATTVEEFDTTTADDRAAAVVVGNSTGEQRLGSTVASLGPPAEPGIWLKTPLVTQVRQGRITYQGKTINIELRPSGGAAGAGSQISLAAMRLIAAPLTALPELEVFSN